MVDVGRVFISGAHSVGKTTLVHDVERAFSRCSERFKPRFEKSLCVAEVTRAIYEERGWTYVDYDPQRNFENYGWLEREVVKRYTEIDLQLTERHSSLLYVMDRGSIDPFVYMQFYGRSRTLFDDICASLPGKQLLDRCKALNSLVLLVPPTQKCLQFGDPCRIPPVLTELQEFTAAFRAMCWAWKIPYVEMPGELGHEGRVNWVMGQIIKKWELDV